MNYFANKHESAERAKEHTEEMEINYKEEIEQCVRRSEIIKLTKENGVVLIPAVPVTDLKNVMVANMSTADAIRYSSNSIINGSQTSMDPLNLPDNTSEMVKNVYGTKIAVLNFASFKHPGGMFIDGSMAQEESLCHVSYLYNILSRFQDSFYEENKKLLNRSLYAHRGIYTPDVRFIFLDGGPLDCAHEALADVFTIAAPNAGAARRIGVSEQDILTELMQRIRFVIQSMLGRGPYMSVILGAFGCGVFKNSPESVAKMFYRELDNIECRNKFYRVIFAIIGDGSIEPFQRILKERRDSFGKTAYVYPGVLSGIDMDFDPSAMI